MKIHVTLPVTTILFFLISFNTASAQDITAGEGSFKQICAACHKIGGGRLVGPDLANVDQRRPEEWILKFVKSSQSVVKSGDKYADSLFQAFNQVVMPDQPSLSDEQIKGIISYIKTKSSTPVSPVTDNTQQTSDQNAGKKAGSFFSTTTILLLGLIVIMLLVIFSLARINKNLLDQIKDFYSSDRSYFKK